MIGCIKCCARNIFANPLNAKFLHYVWCVVKLQFLIKNKVQAKRIVKKFMHWNVLEPSIRAEDGVVSASFGENMFGRIVEFGEFVLI